MLSLRQLYKIGKGPSSSHTMGPDKAARRFIDMYPDADKYKVVLYGSLAKTGVGHRTDWVLEQAFEGRSCNIVLEMNEEIEEHPNTMDFFAYYNSGESRTARFYSVGGGDIRMKGEKIAPEEEIYNLNSFTAISEYCREKEICIWQYVEECEGTEIWDYLAEVWETMKAAVKEGLNAQGILHGGLNIQRKARYLYRQKHLDETEETKTNRLVCAYAFAVSEQNASGGTIVTAPTCGASGVLPAVLYYQQRKRGYSDRDIVRALITGGVIGAVTD